MADSTGVPNTASVHGYLARIAIFTVSDALLRTTNNTRPGHVVTLAIVAGACQKKRPAPE
jgi:hypothetical protein